MLTIAADVKSSVTSKSLPHVTVVVVENPCVKRKDVIMVCLIKALVVKIVTCQLLNCPHTHVQVVAVGAVAIFVTLLIGFAI